MYSRAMTSEPTVLHKCNSALIPKDAAHTLMKYRTVGRPMDPSEVTPDMVAEVKAAAAEVMDCERPRHHDKPHRHGDTEWWDDDE